MPPSTPSAVLTLIRVQHPTFNTPEDRVAFAIHAWVLARGYRLVATGAAAAATPAPLPDAPEVDVQGWNASPVDGYCFRYQDAEGRGRPGLWIKCVAVGGGHLLVQWLQDGTSSDTNVIQIECAEYTTDQPAAPAAYQNFEALVALLDRQLMLGGEEKEGAGASASGAAVGVSVESTGGRGINSGEPSNLQEGPAYWGGGGAGVGVGGVPIPGVGYGDVVPPGVRPPGLVGPPGFPEGGVGVGGGGGMMVGPHHPMFGPGRLGGVGGVGGGDHGPPAPPPAPPPGLPPGARWDPIAPPGMPGFRPGDFQRDRARRDPQHPHPDIMQPGPGRGTDFDSMFG